MHNGGGPVHPATNIVMITLIIGGCTLFYNMISPDIQMKAMHNDNTVTIKMRAINCPESKSIKHMNTDCLEAKGYKIHKYQTHRLISSWSITTNITKPDLIKQEFINDYDECNVNSTVVYSYETAFLRKEKSKKKVLMWADHYEEELK